MERGAPPTGDFNACMPSRRATSFRNMEVDLRRRILAFAVGKKKEKKKKENKNLEEIFSMNIFVFFLLFFVSIVVKWRMFVEISILHGGQKFEDVLMCL